MKQISSCGLFTAKQFPKWYDVEPRGVAKGVVANSPKQKKKNPFYKITFNQITFNCAYQPIEF